eukprot:PhM_4_TR15002/c0_g2_i1/m.3545
MSSNNNNGKAESLYPKFPRTHHLFNVRGASMGGDDIVCDKKMSAHFFSATTPVVVEEKIDGSNLGIFLNEDGEVTCMNRGKVVNYASGSQWRTLQRWLDETPAVLEIISSGPFILYGEWCHAKHTIHYTALPGSPFIAFDIYDRAQNCFLSTARRNAILMMSSNNDTDEEEEGATVLPIIPVVPHLCTRTFAKPSEYEALLKTPSLYAKNCVVEGIYLRIEDANQLIHRAKLVNPEFLQAIDDAGHWQSQEMVKNIVMH